jgi:hypothetical protein
MYKLGPKGHKFIRLYNTIASIPYSGLQCGYYPEISVVDIILNLIAFLLEFITFGIQEVVEHMLQITNIRRLAQLQQVYVVIGNRTRGTGITELSKEEILLSFTTSITHLTNSVRHNPHLCNTLYLHKDIVTYIDDILKEGVKLKIFSINS